MLRVSNNMRDIKVLVHTYIEFLFSKSVFWHPASIGRGVVSLLLGKMDADEWLILARKKRHMWPRPMQMTFQHWMFQLQHLCTVNVVASKPATFGSR